MALGVGSGSTFQVCDGVCIGVMKRVTLKFAGCVWCSICAGVTKEVGEELHFRAGAGKSNLVDCRTSVKVACGVKEELSKEVELMLAFNWVQFAKTVIGEEFSY